MFDRETKLRLAFGAVIALLLHAVVLPSLAAGLFEPRSTLKTQPLREPEKLEPTPIQPRHPTPPPAPEPEAKQEIPIGQDESPLRTSVAWIAYEDFQALVALKSPTHQPAVQAQVDPLRTAPVTVDPTPPAPSVPRPSAPLAQVTPAPPAQPSQRSEAHTPQPDPQGQPADQPAAEAPPVDEGLPVTQLAALPPRLINTIPGEGGPLEAPEAIVLSPRPRVDAIGPEQADLPPAPQVQARSPQPQRAAPAEQEAIDAPRQTPDAPQPAAAPRQEQPARPADAVEPAPARPTSTPKSESDATPTQTNPTRDKVQPGAVLAAEGLQIRTVAPRLSVVARYSSIPDNPVARLVFNRQGQVEQVELLRSSGYENIDGPVVASLYRWRAEGKYLQQIPDRFERVVEILLREKD